MTAKTTVKERPILFAGELVRAILAGRKTVTRRPLKHQPSDDEEVGTCDEKTGHVYFSSCGRGTGDYECHYGKPGDRLWVREAWAIYDLLSSANHYEPGKGNWFFTGKPQPEHRSNVLYRADYAANGYWRPSIHMPRWASRLTLEIADIGVKRLQDIGYHDAVAEGVPTEPFPGTVNGEPATIYPIDPTYQFAVMWNALYGVDSDLSWNANPWVWRIAFKRVEAAP